MTVPATVTICKPFDAHSHLRRGNMLRQVAPHTSRVFDRAVVMPNSDPPIINDADARKYKKEIGDSAGQNAFRPLMTIMLTPATDAPAIHDAWEKGIVAAKLYPRGVTTGSTAGISDFRDSRFLAVLREMEGLGMVLSIHSEEPDQPIISAEQAFLPRIERIVDQYPDLPIIVEHLSTAAAVDLVLKAGQNVAGTITAHHLLLTMEDVLASDGETVFFPWYYCKPVAKTKDDREALIATALSGNSKIFFGSDSAPHPPERKFGPNPAAGIFVPGVVSLPLLAQIFETNASRHNVNDWRTRLERFVSLNGPEFYGLDQATKTITLMRRWWTVPDTYTKFRIVSLWAGRNLRWQIVQPSTRAEIPVELARRRVSHPCLAAA